MILARLLLGVLAAVALPAAVDWKANWIWPGGSEPAPKNYYFYVRKAFDLPAGVSGLKALVSADSHYRLFVNGQYVGRGPVRSFPAFQYYDSYDLDGKLKPGRNVIAAVVLHYGLMTGKHMPSRAGFVLQCEGKLPGGSDWGVYSDSSWKAMQSPAWKQETPRINGAHGFIEVYDAAQEPAGWFGAGFDDSGWPNATVITGVQSYGKISAAPAKLPIDPWLRMIPRDIPMLFEEEIFPVSVVGHGNVKHTADPGQFEMDVAATMQAATLGPLRVGTLQDVESILRADGKAAVLQTAAAPGPLNVGLQDLYVTVDFGKEVTGYPRLRMEGVQGCIVDMGYSELLTEGRVMPLRGGVRWADRYIMKDGPQTFELFAWKGFRYMQLSFRNCPQPVRIDSVSLNFSTYPVGERGKFATSDPLLTKIWEASRYTVQMCMHDGFEDCPWREQRQWVEDGRVEALINYYTFGDRFLPANFLRQIARSQTADGQVATVAPGNPTFPVADDTLEWILTVRDHYWYTGDSETAVELYPQIAAAIRGFRDYVNDHGLLENVPYRVFFDWVDMENRGEITALNAQYYRALMNAAEIGRLAGDERQAKQFEATAARVKESINARLWDEARGVYRDCRAGGQLCDTVSQIANTLVLQYEIAPRERWPRMLSGILSGKDVVETESFYAQHVLSGLFHGGRGADAMKFIREKYGHMIQQGATTIWEIWRYDVLRYRGKAEAVNWSLCHGWSAAPGFHLPAEVLGVKPTRPGFAEFVVRPGFYDLEWANGVVPSPRGDIPVSWKRSGKNVRLEVKVPDGTRAEVVLPEGKARLDGRAAAVKAEAGEVRLALPPGAHVIEID